MTLHYIQIGTGFRIWDNSGSQKNLVIFPRQAVKILDCPEKKSGQMVTLPVLRLLFNLFV